MADSDHPNSRGVRLYLLQSLPVNFWSNFSGLHVRLTEHRLTEFSESFLIILLFVFLLQPNLLVATPARHRDDVLHPVGGGRLEDRAPEEVV